MTNLFTCLSNWKLKYLCALLVCLCVSIGNVWGTVPSGWSQVTALSGISAGDKIIIVTNDGSMYLNGSVGSGHFSATALDASHPASASAAGVIQLVSTGTSNKYKLLLVSTSKYVTATAAKSGSASVSATSDNYGWTFTSSTSGEFDAQYQETGKQAYCRSYSNSSFRTYGTKSGATFQIYKYSSSDPSITVSTTSLSGVGYSTTDFSQEVKSFTVSGSSLTANVTVSAPDSFEVCKTSDGTYASSVTFDKGSGTLSASTVYVRLKSGKAAYSYSGNITCSSSGATNKTVALSGSVPFTVTWQANTTTVATTYVAYASGAGTAIGSLPEEPDPDDYACTGKEFYGWYGEEYSNASVAPTIITTSTKITSDTAFNAVFATASGSGTRTVSANLATLKSAVSDITSGYSSKTFEMTYSDESYTFTADVTKSVQTSTSGWLQVGKFPTDNRYITITDEFPGKITNISSSSIYNASSSTYTGIVYYNTSASIETPIATDTLTTASSFSMDITGGSTGGYIMFEKAICLGELSVSYSTTTYSDFSTTCCAYLITLNTPTITDAASSGSTVTYTESSPVATCSGAATVHVTVSPAAGYQATSISFGGTATNTGISPSVSVPLNSEQEYAISYAKNTTSGTLAPSVTFAAKPLNSISLSAASGTVYVDQYVDFTVSYDPSDYLSKGYTLTATPTYVTKVSQAPANTLLRLKGGRSSGAGASITTTQTETVSIQASGDNTKTTSVSITVKPLPKVHFVDIVHGIAFDDVVATIEENELVEDQPTPTHDDISSPESSNTCENTHLHLIGWIDSSWSGVANYLDNTTDAAPTTEDIKGAGSGVWITAGADIDTKDKDGHTYYAVWAKVE